MAPVLTPTLQTALLAPTFQAEMVEYIRRHFGSMLGEDAALLEQPGGLDILAAKMHGKFRALHERRPG